jgi:hypothetical protein
VLSGCTQMQGPVVMSCEDHADVVRQAHALGLAYTWVPMPNAATNAPMRELLMSNRPLPAPDGQPKR